MAMTTNNSIKVKATPCARMRVQLPSRPGGGGKAGLAKFAAQWEHLSNILVWMDIINPRLDIAWTYPSWKSGNPA